MEAHFAFRISAMQVLLAWSILNLVVGGLGARRASTRAHQAFWGGSAAWNTVNLAIAAGGWWGAVNPDPIDGAALLREMVFFRDVLLTNVGLDVGYMAVGVVTWLWGRDRSEPWRTGIGLALVLQGLFLFVFDVALTVLVSSDIGAAWPA